MPKGREILIQPLEADQYVCSRSLKPWVSRRPRSGSSDDAFELVSACWTAAAGRGCRTVHGARLLNGGVPIWEALRRQRRTGYWIA